VLDVGFSSQVRAGGQTAAGLTTKQRRYIVKKELLTLAASLAIATSLNASVNHPATRHAENAVYATRLDSMLMAREKEPNDKRRGRGKDDPKGHKFADQLAREAEPKDDRGHKRGRGKDDPKGHKFSDQLAREAEPKDDRGHKRGRGKDDPKGHKFADHLARETQPVDKKGKGKDGKGHKLA